MRGCPSCQRNTLTKHTERPWDFVCKADDCGFISDFRRVTAAKPKPKRNVKLLDKTLQPCTIKLTE